MDTGSELTGEATSVEEVTDGKVGNIETTVNTAWLSDQ
jgi:hypothetical protein